LFVGIYNADNDKWQKWLSDTIVNKLVDMEGKCINCKSEDFFKEKNKYICSSCGENVNVRIAKPKTTKSNIDFSYLLENVEATNMINTCDDEELPF
jgi:DNA replicative helicase MCM subunit Mcm2 (Cdc46/Mcm family)